MTEDRAETVALTALGWLAGHDELMPVFLGSTGTSTEEMAARAGDQDFLASVLDFLCMDDGWIAELCQSTDLKPTEPLTARHILSGEARSDFSSW